MRDDEFKKVYDVEVPRLDKYFHKCLKNAKYPLPYEAIKRSLINRTGEVAWKNSRKGNLSGYSINALIWLKAGDIWIEFVKSEKKGWVGLHHLKEEESKEPDALHRMLVRERLEQLKSKIDPETWDIFVMMAEGMTYSEIAASMNVNVGTVKMKVHRTRKGLDR